MYKKEQLSFINQLLDLKFHESNEQGFIPRVLALSDRANAIGIYNKIHQHVTEDGSKFVDADDIDFSLGEKALLKKFMEEPMPRSGSVLAEEILTLLDDRNKEKTENGE